MKRILILMLILSLALMFIGCSDDDDKDDEKMTQLSFKNLTNAELTITLDGVKETIQVDAGETSTYNFDNEIFVDGDEMPINYNVTGIYIATQARTATITKGETTIAEIIAEGGVIVLTNDYFYAIEDVRIYTGTSTGNNILTEPLTTGQSITVLKDPDTYTINVRLETDEIEFMNDIVVVDNETTPVSYYKRVFELENKTASAITYKLDNEAANSVASNASVSRELDETFGDEVAFNYNGLYLFAETLTLDYSTETHYGFEMVAQGGAIFIVNNTSDNITEVYLTQTTNWGPDYMAGTITPGNSFAWTVQEGLWNVKIVDSAGYEAEIIGMRVNLNESKYVDYGDKGRAKSTSINLPYDTNYTPVNGARVEAN